MTARDEREEILTREELVSRCRVALACAGATEHQATLVAEAVAQAELGGRRPVGVSHLLDYLDGFRTGRISATTTLEVERRTGVVLAVDCLGGVPQEGFDVAAGALRSAADDEGLAVLALRNAFTAGELGYYVRRLTDHGYFALAVAASPALMAAAGSRGPLLGTNPIAFGVPLPDGRTVAVDQACSATAWVSVRDAALAGEAIPEGWAVAPDGSPTTSAAAGLTGALLPFGGFKGGNLALLVELLSTLAGGTFSSQAPPFDRGSSSPAVGVVVLALSLARLDPGYPARLEEQLDRWADEHGADTSVWTSWQEAQVCRLPPALLEQLR